MAGHEGREEHKEIKGLLVQWITIYRVLVEWNYYKDNDNSFTDGKDDHEKKMQSGQKCAFGLKNFALCPLKDT